MGALPAEGASDSACGAIEGATPRGGPIGALLVDQRAVELCKLVQLGLVVVVCVGETGTVPDSHRRYRTL